ncbi:MAG: type II toxin-antitoxin system VapC family toxin [Pseudorhodoplanes sp.]
MRSFLLLDTCAAIWLSTDRPVAESAREAVREAHREGKPIYVSPITAWEIALLAARGRMNLLSKPETWFERLLAAPGLELADMPPSVLIASSFLPATELRDPADRILAATAREYGYTIVTRDRPLLQYGAQGHVRVLAC